MAPEVLASVEAQVRDTICTPGMYDEPDAGLSLPLPVSDEEDRITSGAPVPASGIDQSKHPHPSVIAPFEGMQTTFRVTAEKSDRWGVTELTGYPVDSWRFSETALAVRVTRQRPAHPFTYGTDLTGTDFIVLPDDREWSAQSPTHQTGLRHLPAHGHSA